MKTTTNIMYLAIGVLGFASFALAPLAQAVVPARISRTPTLGESVEQRLLVELRYL